MTTTEELPDFSAMAFEPSGEESTGETPQRTRKRRSDAGQPRTRSTGTRRTGTAKLAADLADPIAKLAMGIAFTSPTAAAVLLSRGEDTAKALVQIAEGHPRMLAALQKASRVGPASELAQTGLMLFIAIQVDTGRMPPEHPLAGIVGVSELHAKVTQQQTADMGEDVILPFRPPPGFDRQEYTINDPQHPLYSFSAGIGAAQA